MKLSEKTITVLKNLASINNSIVVKPGNLLATVSPQKSILAKITVEEEFKQGFAIYDITQFLNVLSLFVDPELKFGKQEVLISSGNEKVNYRYADEGLIQTPPAKEITFPSPEVTFDLSGDSLAKILKAQSVLGVPEIAVVGKDGTITIGAVDSKQLDGNSYKFEIGETDLEFTAIFKRENIKLLPADYTVEVSSRGISKFTSADGLYFVAVESNSKYGEE